MNDELLKRAAEAVRERYDGATELAAAGELRVLRAFDRRVRRRRRAPLFAIPLVAAVIASAAWGTGSARLRALLHLAGGAEVTARITSSKASPKVGAQRSAPQAPAPLPEPLTPSAEPFAPLPEASALRKVRSAPPSARAVQRAPLVAPTPSSPVGNDAPSESEIAALYRAAHHAQFSGGDPSQTLVLWDRYLAAAPNGALSPEARYNRAITLAHLGRKAEAAAALERFARGDYGGYRKAEASSLLEVLRAP